LRLLENAKLFWPEERPEDCRPWDSRS
jgi:hypothetical protein